MPASGKKGIWSIVWKMAVLLLSFPILMGTCLHLFPMFFLDGEYPYYRENKEYMRGREGSCRVMILGDSAGKCSWYVEDLSPDAYNCALGGSSAIEEYYCLREYLEYNEAPQVIFYTPYPSHFFAAGLVFGRSAYFHRLRLADLADLLQTTSEENPVALFGVDHPALEALLYTTYSPLRYSTAVLNALGSFSRMAQNNERYRETKAHRGWARIGTPGHGDQVRIMPFDSFTANRVVDSYLRRTLSLCEEYGIQFIYQGIPFNEATYRALREGFFSDYIGYLQALQADYPAARIDTELNYYDNAYFDDATHLTPTGARRFTAEMREKYAEFFPADAA